jgi:predicted HicB family RNase H-like nuclease
MKTRKEIPKYLKIVEWSDEDNCYVGSAPPLIGPCCHGKDESRVFAQLCQIVDEWIEILKKDGKPLPAATVAKTYSGKFLLRVQPGLHRRLAVQAESEGESLNEYVARKLMAA